MVVSICHMHYATVQPQIQDRQVRHLSYFFYQFILLFNKYASIEISKRNIIFCRGAGDGLLQVILSNLEGMVTWMQYNGINWKFHRSLLYIYIYTYTHQPILQRVHCLLRCSISSYLSFLGVFLFLFFFHEQFHLSLWCSCYEEDSSEGPSDPLSKKEKKRKKPTWMNFLEHLHRIFSFWTHCGHGIKWKAGRQNVDMEYLFWSILPIRSK